MAKLTHAQKVFIVQRLACFETPLEVSTALKAEYGIEVSKQAVEKYDPTKRAGEQLRKDLRDLFDKRRKRFRDEIDDIPEANKTVRVRDLALAARAFKESRNYIAMADMLERIAKEMGNVHSNRRELTGKDGKPMQFEDVTTMTDDELKAELARHLLGAVAAPKTH